MERKHLKVLVIDDEEDVFILVKAFLNKGVRAKYEVQWANNFNHGLHQLMDKKFDVVLLDYFLGEKTGLELLQKAIKKGCDHPIIMLTSHNDPELDIKVLKAGGMGYLIKDSFDADNLERSIHYSIERKELLRKLQRERNQYADISADFADFIRVVGYDLHPYIKKISVEGTRLRDEKLGLGQQKQIADNIQKNVEAVNKIIESFLNLEGEAYKKHVA